MFLEQERIALRDPVDPSRTASLDPALRTFVNYEIFFFADEVTKAAFDADPTRWCGRVTDPVSQRRFLPAPMPLSRTYMDRLYYFESDATLEAFEATPDSFAVRKGM
jgi:YHS domain-containing protein